MNTIMPISIQNIKRMASQGFTLVEVLVSLVILAVGLLGLAMLQTTGLRNNTNSYSRTQATYLAYDLVDRMRANAVGFSAGNYFVSNTGAISIVGTSSYSCNQSTSPTCACDTGACSSSALAQYDLGQWYYRLDTQLPGAKDAANQASPQRATIASVAGNSNRATITIYWLEQNRNAAAGGATSELKSQTWTVDIYPL